MNVVHVMTDDSSAEQNIDFIEQVALFTLSEEQQNNIGCSILCTSSTSIRQYNREYRNKDSVTDVLSFCVDEDSNENVSTTIDYKSRTLNQAQLRETKEKFLEFTNIAQPQERYIGDIVLCLSVINQQAIEYGIHFLEELVRTVVHGILHILGYTHNLYEEDEPMLVRQEQVVSTFMSTTNIGKDK